MESMGVAGIPERLKKRPRQSQRQPETHGDKEEAT